MVHPGRGFKSHNKILCMCLTAAPRRCFVTGWLARPAASQYSATRYSFVVVFEHRPRFMVEACKGPAVRPVDALAEPGA